MPSNDDILHTRKIEIYVEALINYFNHSFVAIFS